MESTRKQWLLGILLSTIIAMVSCSEGYDVSTTAALPTTTTVALTTTTVDAQDQTEEFVPIEVSSYAADFSVSPDEARRRLDRIYPIQDILGSIAEIEVGRVAGRGIDHAGDFRGWIWLLGDEPPSVEAARIADAHSDVEIRLSAAHTYDDLRAAQDSLFADLERAGILADIEPLVTYTGINHEANAIRIGIDPSAPVETGPCDLADPYLASDEAFHATAAEVAELLRDVVDVAFVIEDGQGMSHFEWEEEPDCPAPEDSPATTTARPEPAEDAD